VSGAFRDYVYDAEGNVVAEDISAGWQTGYVYLNGRMIAEYEYSTTYFVTGDQLGSSRLLTTLTGGVQDCNGFYPYGEQDLGICSSTNTTTHKFTGKERDTESGLDNFGARYNASSLGRFMTPDPILVSWRRMVNPQVWNAYSYVGNNPLRFVDPNGEELIKLGQHTDDQIKQREKEIKEELKNKDLSKDQKNALKKERNTLNLEQQGNHVVGSLLANLDKAGQRNGLQLSNFTLTTDTKGDFAGHTTAEGMQKLLDAQAFVIQGNGQFGGTIYIRTEPETGFYQMSQRNSDFGYYGASALSHEQVHLNGGGEYPAFQRQLGVFEGFLNFFQNPALYRGLDESIRDGIKANQPR
jgi:RHS repeat-associated protein